MDNYVKPIRVGSRKSELALVQTKHVVSLLQNMCPKKKFEIHTMTTIGDRVLNISLPKIGEKSLFTRDLEDALRNGGVDLVVHSLKDLPTVLPTGMAIGAVLEREDARDALVLRNNYKGYTISTLPAGSVIGTSSLRRTAQLRRQYPHLVVCDIRGNLNTRLAKLDAEDSKFAGIILAQAGLVRMGWHERINQTLEPSDLLYAVGQGALAVECRSNDTETLAMLRNLMCLPTTCRILAERSFLKTLGGGCSAPVAVLSNLKGDLGPDGTCSNPVNLHLDGAVWSLDGSVEIRQNISCSLVEPKDNDEPPTKRTRTISVNSIEMQNRVDVISDDTDVNVLTDSYTINDLVDKHINLAKKCPVIRDDAINNDMGGGDTKTAVSSCPLTFDVGQDFMGQCPFVGPEYKVSFSLAQRPNLTNDTNGCANNEDSNGNPAECIPTPSTSKCPFSSMHSKTDLMRTSKAEKRAHSADEVKCPFLQKTVQMFDYANHEKPESNANTILIESVDNLFCGLFHHDCHDRELYTKSNKLGKELAEYLIKKGALEVMKVAQSEIHSKA